MKYFSHRLGKTQIIGLLRFCAFEIEKWQIENELETEFKKILGDERAVKFEFLQQIRIELQNNVNLFSEREDKFREIEKWISNKMKNVSVIFEVSVVKSEVNSALLIENPKKRKEALSEAVKSEFGKLPSLKFHSVPKKDIKDFIKPELVTLLEKLEEKIFKNQEKTWASRIKCAAFCELLYEKKYFLKGATRIKSVAEFALLRYGMNIQVQLKGDKKVDRITHKEQLRKYFV